MVSSCPNPVKDRSFPKPKQARHVGKKVQHVKGHSQEICCKKVCTFTQEWYDIRRDIGEALKCYRRLRLVKGLRDKVSNNHGMSPERGKCSGLALHKRVASLLKRLGKWVNTTKQIGCVAGVEIGDEFHWRGELCIVGLHSEFQRGIDCIASLNGRTWATSIVDSGRYDSATTSRVSPNEFTYCGEGENPIFGGKKKAKVKDQKLVGGNLALMNNMVDRKPVRVIRKYNHIGNANDSGYKFVYEGLYRVTKYWKEIRGDSGTYVYKFNLVKMEDHQQYDSEWKKKYVWHRRH
ncbi:hypothetical protein HRI_002464700 [Hibiscus trionum]|uniref:YDG domain-containing protein n=1 Tax=Hibiscus trionum TaxID=183268 RepID=A0A9W7I263_HIBTR|nr:hypothetical protein HRI_002464700 [Hibiscus trionum]